VHGWPSPARGVRRAVGWEGGVALDCAGAPECRMSERLASRRERASHTRVGITRRWGGWRWTAPERLRAACPRVWPVAGSERRTRVRVGMAWINLHSLRVQASGRSHQDLQPSTSMRALTRRQSRTYGEARTTLPGARLGTPHIHRDVVEVVLTAGGPPPLSTRLAPNASSISPCESNARPTSPTQDPRVPTRDPTHDP
jgi:hypothetical protein